MGCYQCGSDEGNQAKLCPTCTQARLAHLRQLRGEDGGQECETPAAQGSEPSERKASRPRLDPQWTSIYLPSAAAAAFVGVMAWLFLFSVYGPGWGLSRSERLYKRCMYRFDSAIDASAQKTAPPPSDPMKGLTQGLLVGMGTALCEGLRDACDDPKQAETCAKLSSAGF